MESESGMTGYTSKPGGTRIAVIGSGAAGTLVAAQLLRQSADSRLQITLIERGDCFGRGIAYSTTSRKHLLNVPAGKMSALPDDPDHLLRWLAKGPVPEAVPYTFVPRRIFGDYLEATLHEAEAASPARLKHVRGEAVRIDFTAVGPTVRLEKGCSVHADAVVLATGNLPAKNPPVNTDSFYQSTRYVPDAWEPGALSDVLSDEPVLLIGTSLTAIDVALALKERGHEGEIHAVSRRGLVPNPHASAAQEPHPEFLPKDGTPFRLRELLRKLRFEARDAELDGRHWQSAIDVLRPRTQQLWETATDEDRRRFLRHVQPYWEAHRHRIAPEVGEEIARMREDGDFKVHAGRILSYDESHQNVGVEVSLRGGGRRVIEVAKVINCTGPHTDVRKTSHPLLGSLLETGHVRPGPLDLGLETDEEGALVNSGGRASGVLYTLGTHRKGHLWETIAIPEIRQQAAEIAKDVLSPARQNRCRSRLAG